MVATSHILKVDAADPASVQGLTRYYAAGTKYYTNSGERPGVWVGKGAAALGLTGEVSAKALNNLFMGKSPDGRSELVKVRVPSPEDVASLAAQKKRQQLHVPGYDITFSVPKSVSALWAISDEPIRRLIERAIDTANRQILQWMESELKFARRGKGGNRHEFAKLVIAMFDHTTARNALDPSLHTHCVLLNLCQGERDGKWSKVDSRSVLRWVRTLGPMHRNTVLHELTRLLGVEGYRPQVDGEIKEWFELKGISEKLTSKLSSRRKEILAEAELFCGSSSSVKARQNANLRTRKPKGQRPSDIELHKKWRADAIALGQTPESLKKVTGRRTEINVEQRVELAIENAAKTCVTDRAYFGRHKFIQRVSEELQDVPIPGVEVVKRADAALLNQALFRSIQVPQSQESIFTTKKMWELETNLLQTVDVLKNRKGAVVSQKRVDRILTKHSELSSEQQSAVRHLLQTRGALKCLTGVAGAGKTRTLNAVKEAFEAAGYKVVGTALSGAAKEELAAKAKIETRTVASYEYHLSKTTRQKVVEHVKHDIRMLFRAAIGKSTWQKPDAPKLDKRTVLFIDEAGMLDTPHTSLLLRAARRSGATVIEVGDGKQLSPLGPGGPFKRITEMVPTTHLSENFRQRSSPLDAQAAADLRDGNVAAMLESYVRRGRMTIAPNREKAAQSLVTEWAKDGGAMHPEQSIILTQTREEARHLNRLCQMERKLDGQVSGKSIKIHGETYHVGDRVMFHDPKRSKGIENGYQAKVTAFNSLTKSITVTLDREPSPQQKKMGRSRVVTLKESEVTAGFITLGYAATTHKLQGQSRQFAYCLMGGALTNSEMTYVQITRGELMTKLFTDRHHAGPKLADLAEAMKKSGAKDLAHDLGQRLRIQRDFRGEQS